MKKVNICTKFSDGAFTYIKFSGRSTVTMFLSIFNNFKFFTAREGSQSHASSRHFHTHYQ
ncbi:hypothetical protein C0J52_08768 [Blattella germanica]|nr:hypothetical protein C0J52_08768 [Blattella germanica]